jgi:DNA topoisomerase-1
MNLQEISPAALARAVKLRYVSCGKDGYKRIKKGNSFVYLDQNGELLQDEETLQRIKGLVLPPAWTDVWICPYPNGHLQATGIDASGRKQYRYHSKWSQVRNERKYDRLYAFGKLLPNLRRQMQKDLRLRSLCREKVSAIALSIMYETCIRSGNASYERKYGSYGLTTLKNKHISINGSRAFFRFRGKKGVQHKIELSNAALVRLLKHIKDLPGQELFQYIDDTGTTRRLESGDINEYLQQHTAEHFTCKDFRTWAGTLAALELMVRKQEIKAQEQVKISLPEIIDGVAERLGNTRTVCRKYYIHPELLRLYEQGRLERQLNSLQRKLEEKDWNQQIEKTLLQILKPFAA